MSLNRLVEELATGRTLISADAHMEEIDELPRENWAVVAIPNEPRRRP